MNQPSEKEDPEDAREHELNQRHEDATLRQLPEAGNEKTAHRRDDVTR